MIGLEGEPTMRRIALLACACLLAGILTGCIDSAPMPDGSAAAGEPSIPKPDVPTPNPADPGVTITYSRFDPASGALEVSGYVAGTVVTDGTCTIVAELGADRRESSTTAEPNAGDTQCGTLVLDSMAPGDWKVSLHFTSASTGELESEPILIAVPTS
jgi:hypothetical protein